jgi:hypothetical protein
VALLPQGILLILNQKVYKRSAGGVGEVVLAEGYESHVRHLLDAIVEVNAYNGSSVRCCTVGRDLHLNLTRTQAMSLKQATSVGWDQLVVAELDESTQEL